MAKDHAGSNREAAQGSEQATALPLIGQHPEARQRLAAVHAAFYSNHMTGSSPSEKLTNVQSEIAKAARLAGRSAEAITLIAVSKGQPAEAIVPLLEAGQRHFGENRVQEAQSKWPALREQWPDVSLHLIGQLQSNKAGEAVALFDYIHSVDRASLVSALAKAMEKTGGRLHCFMQVNIGQELQKGGCAVSDLPLLLSQCEKGRLPIQGLMAIPPAEIEAAPYFALLAKLARRHNLAGLSMGMSADFSTAVTLGSSHVRVGSALFASRARTDFSG